MYISIKRQKTIQIMTLEGNSKLITNSNANNAIHFARFSKYFDRLFGFVFISVTPFSITCFSFYSTILLPYYFGGVVVAVVIKTMIFYVKEFVVVLEIVLRISFRLKNWQTEGSEFKK